jgi:hypothetical protein
MMLRLWYFYVIDMGMTKTPVMVCNMADSKVAIAVAERIIKSPDFELFPLSTTNLEYEFRTVTVGGVVVTQVGKNDRGSYGLESCHHGRLFVVDFPKNHNALNNGEWYSCNGWPLFMIAPMQYMHGLRELVNVRNGRAVLTSNPVIEINAVQKLVGEFAGRNEGLLRGCSLEVTTNKQKDKYGANAFTEAMVKHFNALGIVFGMDDVKTSIKPASMCGISYPGNLRHFSTDSEWYNFKITKKAGDPTPQITALRQLFDGFAEGKRPSFGGTVASGRYYDVAKSLQGWMVHSVDNKAILKVAWSAAPTDAPEFSIKIRVDGDQARTEGAIRALRFLRDDAREGRTYSMMQAMWAH